MAKRKKGKKRAGAITRRNKVASSGAKKKAKKPKSSDAVAADEVVADAVVPDSADDDVADAADDAKAVAAKLGADDDSGGDDGARDDDGARAEHVGFDFGGDDDDGSDEDDEDGELPKRGASWGWPLARFDRRWTWLETRLMFGALVLLTFLLCMWFAIRGMKEPLEAKEAAGTIFRAFAGAAILGGFSRLLTRGRLEESKRNATTVAAVLIGLATATLWRGVGIAYFAGLLDWLQEGSTLTLMGGLKGVSTRLTMAVALLGASLAASSGTHINIDVVVRFIPIRLRKLVNITGGVATAAVCIAVAIGFGDFVAVTGFGANVDDTPGQKVAAIQHEMGEHFFLWRKQAKLDIGAFGYVVRGEAWNDPKRMNGRQWNEFLDEEGFVERYGAEKVDTLRAVGEDLDESRTPFVTAPHGKVRGALLHGMDLIFPLGFFMIGLRFVLRALLVLSGFIVLDEQDGSGEEEDDDEDRDDELGDDAATEGVS